MALPEPQEWFLEELMRAGEAWQLSGTAYAVFYEDVLVEFHTEDSSNTATHLSELKRNRPFQKAFCKSYDQPLLDAAHTLGGTATKFAHLFRKRIPINRALPHGFHLTKAEPSELDIACQLGRGFFDSREEAQDLLQTGGLWIARSGAEPVGCGVTNPLVGPYNAVDIGMVVTEPWRKQGFGTAIVRALADAAEKQGQRPICGCAGTNIASKSALERAGFVSEHSLMRLDFPA